MKMVVAAQGAKAEMFYLCGNYEVLAGSARLTVTFGPTFGPLSIADN